MARKADGWAIQLRVTLHGWLPNTPWIMKSVTNESALHASDIQDKSISLIMDIVQTPETQMKAVKVQC